MINAYTSAKFQVISAFCMVMVVFIHSYNYDIKTIGSELYVQHSFIFFFENFVSNGLGRIAVPIFFAISSYLFFINISDLKQFPTKLKKKLRTVALPCLLWSVWGLVLYFFLQSIPFSKSFFTKDLVSTYSTSKIFSTVFLNPIPYQLWFLQNLFILMLISPIIYFLIKFFGYGLLLSTMFLWFIHGNQNIIFIESLNYFVLGASIAVLHPGAVLFKFRKQFWIMGIAWGIVLMFSTMTIDNEKFDSLRRINILVGIPAAWTLYDVMFSQTDWSKMKYFKHLKYSFFIYIFHEPSLVIIKKALLHLLPKNQFSIILTYIAAPIIIVLISIIIGNFINKNFKKFYAVLTGGR